MFTSKAAGLSFSKCHAERKVPYDPHLPGIFDGEEFSRAARLWTYGYDIYTPHRAYAFHDYRSSFLNPVKEEWMKNPDWKVLEASQKRIRGLIGMPNGLDEKGTAFLRRSLYGLGDRRTLDQFIAFTGVDTRISKV